MNGAAFPSIDPAGFAPVIVSPVLGGLYAIIDGQHRATAAALCGIELVPCNVVLADRREQALAFEAINSQVTRVTRQQIYKARLASGDAEALRIAAAVKAAGVRILPDNSPSSRNKPHETMALASIARALAQHGDEVLVCALRGIVLAAGAESGLLTGLTITAASTVLADHPEWAGHRGIGDAMAMFDLLSEVAAARQRAMLIRGTNAQDNLQSRLVEHLADVLSGRRRRLAAE